MKPSNLITSPQEDVIPALDNLFKYRKEIYPGQIFETYLMACWPGCDIAGHVPNLIQYGQKVQHITEMGVRFGWSTRSFLIAQPKTLTSIDLGPWQSTHVHGGGNEHFSPPCHHLENPQYEKYRNLYSSITDFKYIIGDTTQLQPIEETELLFIDTKHDKNTLEQELKIHGNRSIKYIIFHDTNSFGNFGEGHDPNSTTSVGTGLWYAIIPWLQENKHWFIKEHFDHTCGLTILERRS